MNLKYIPLIIIGISALFMSMALQVLWPAADEMVFIRVTENLPAYRSYSTWWSLDGKTEPSDILNNPELAQYFEVSQNSLIWYHPPIPSLISYPIVKVLNIDKANATPKSIESAVCVLRFLAALMLIFCMYGIYTLVRKEISNYKYMIISMIPFVGMLVFFTKQGNNWFYPETFTVLFLTIALMLRKSAKYKKYIYIPLTLMVGSSIYAIAFLIPFIIENKKTALCSLVLAPYLVWSFILTGNALYPYYHLYVIGTSMSPLSDIPSSHNFIVNRIIALLSNIKGAWELLIFTIPSYAYLLYKYFKSKNHLFYILLMTISLIFGLFWWVSYYQMLPIAILTPLLVIKALKGLPLNRNVILARLAA